MSMLRTSLCLFWILLISCKLYAQLTDSAFDLISQKEDACVLSESSQVQFSGVKSRFMWVIVEKELIYKVNTQRGADELSKLDLPEPFDYLIDHLPRIKQSMRLFSNSKLDTVAFFKKEGGTFTEIPREITVRYDSLINNNQLLNGMHYFTIRASSIQPGDTVKVNYKLRFPFIDNYQLLFSLRLFHHGKWPKKEYSLKWSFNSELMIDTTFNLAIPTTSINNKKVTLSWDFKNLPGCLDEPNAHCYTNLPWFVFTPRPPELLVQHFDSFKEETFPIWQLLSYTTENHVNAAKIDVNQGIKTKDQFAFNHLADSIKRRFPEDSIGDNRLRSFQTWMLNDVLYKADKEYYRGENKYMKFKPGLDLEAGVLKEPSRVNAYANMLLRLGSNVVTAYPMDKRCGKINSRYYTSIYNNDVLLLSIFKNGNLRWVYPKSDIANYYVDEMPFYFENTNVMIQDISQKAAYKHNAITRASFFTTPSSTASDNSHKINGQVTIDLKSNRQSFKTRLSLSGQYSTLMRNPYYNRPTDPSILPKYHQKVEQIGSSPKLISQVITSQSDVYPFLLTIQSEFTTQIMRESDSCTLLDLADCFRFTIPDSIASETRFTDFYADFVGSETFSFLLQFNANIVLLDPSKVFVDNTFGSFEFSTRQLEGDKLLVTGHLLTKREKVEANEIRLVEEIYHAANSRNNYLIKIKPNEL